MRSKLASTTVGFLVLFLSLAASGLGQTLPERVDYEMVEKIKAEGLERSQIMDVISYLTDVHGPRLTGSPLTKAAADWTLSKFKEWGLENGHTESWGPFGRGWTLEGCMVNLVEPSYAPLIAHVKAWSPSTTRTIKAVPIYLEAESSEDLEKYRGKLGRSIVLISPPRDLAALFEPPATRQDESSLLRLANARPPTVRGRESGARSSSRQEAPAPAAASEQKSASQELAESPEKPAADNSDASQSKSEGAESSKSTEAAKEVPTQNPQETPSEGSQAAKLPAAAKPAGEAKAEAPASPATPPTQPRQNPRAAYQLLADKWQMAYDEGAAVVLEPGRGDGGNVFVASVTMPRRSEDQGEQGNRFSRGPRPWATEATGIIPQAVLAAEHYNRLVRMIQKGAAPTLEVDILCSYHDDDPNSFNIFAEIPGTDLADEVVMLGGHFDSWQSGTGATDNAVGCGVAMEAMRILKAIDAQPRRTIRLALWTGEEQGLLGSRAYVADHFGKIVYDEAEEEGEQRGSRGRRQSKYVLKPEQEKISAYYNLDNGTGKIRGIYLQGNEELRPIFRSWLTPFEDMEASTVSVSNTGGTDHLSFDSIGIPGFQFIQDPLEYNTRTHHSSMDVYDRIQADDVKQAAIIMASFVYHTAMRDEQLPRKRLPGPVIMESAPTESEAPAETVTTAAGEASEE